jgi:PKD repeat protein
MTWDFGDGFRANGAAPTHTYTRAGAFLVRLTVTDNAGNSVVKTQVILVS